MTQYLAAHVQERLVLRADVRGEAGTAERRREIAAVAAEGRNEVPVVPVRAPEGEERLS
ncbi:hypothetical protein [Actinomadura macrotermitis]|uniref:Uncharacterized protein n=1 Tax=Actinomadura macrotermitis TaxID=2585200 RepID=A0A7K0BTN4_9ACTN|nr:hypothetical protein [Actinomadura macrotermitis]MQY04511.1 hypothetical protein [Actinomadura macrotermitis]